MEDKEVKKKLKQELQEVLNLRRDEKKDISSKIIRPKKLSYEEHRKKIANEEKMRSRRDEDIKNVLISDVPQSLKDEHADYIVASHKTSKAKETFVRIEKERRLRVWGECDWGADPIDDRETYWNDWWKTDALIKNSIEMTKYDAKCRRKQKVKDFFYKISGLKLMNNLNHKRKEKQDNDMMVLNYLDIVALDKTFQTNKEKILSELLTDFIHFILKYKIWRMIMTRETSTAISVKFMEKHSLKENDRISKKMLLDFYEYFCDKDNR